MHNTFLPPSEAPIRKWEYVVFSCSEAPELLRQDFSLFSHATAHTFLHCKISPWTDAQKWRQSTVWQRIIRRVDSWRKSYNYTAFLCEDTSNTIKREMGYCWRKAIFLSENTAVLYLINPLYNCDRAQYLWISTIKTGISRFRDTVDFGDLNSS